MCRCKLNGQKISVRDVLDDATREKIVRLNEGYYIFKDIRNTPAYLSQKKTSICNDPTVGTSSSIYFSICS